MDVMIISPDDRRWLYCAISFSFWDSKPLLWSIFLFRLIVFIIIIFIIFIFQVFFFGREMRSLSPYDRIWFQLCYNFLNYISQISDLSNFGKFFVFTIIKVQISFIILSFFKIKRLVQFETKELNFLGINWLKDEKFRFLTTHSNL